MSALSTQTYFFQAMKPTGGKTMGLRAAGDEAKLAEELRREDLLLLKAWRVPVGSSAPAKIPLKDEAELNDQLRILLSRGVPLTEALEVAATVVGPASRARVNRMKELVSGGASFADACAQVGGFEPVTIAVYRSAERTGDLTGAAERLSKSARRRLSISGKAVTVMIYPAVIVTIALLMFCFLLIFIVPKMAQTVRPLIESNGGKLPWFSAVVFNVGEWLNAHLMLSLLIGMGLLCGAIIIWRRVVKGISFIGRKFPAVANLLLTVEMTRFFSVMGAMTKTGVPLADALAGATGVISSTKLREQLNTLQRNLVEGGLLRTLIEKVDALPLSTRRLLIAAERSGDLDSAFDSLAGEMADEVDKKSARLLALLEPMMIVAMFLLLGPLIIAIAIPLISARSVG